MRSAALGEVPHELRAVGASSALLSERLPLVQSRSRKTTSFPIPLFTVGIRPSLSLGLISVLNISLRNFQGRCLLFSYQGSLFCFRISATTSISYHVASDLSTTFLTFFLSVSSRIERRCFVVVAVSRDSFDIIARGKSNCQCYFYFLFYLYNLHNSVSPDLFFKGILTICFLLFYIVI